MAHSTLATIKGAFGDTSLRWEGHATPQGTEEYSTGSALGFSHSPAHFRNIYRPSTSSEATLTLSSLGVGTYLGAPDHETDEKVENAIVKSVGDGWNVLDTAANYRSGHAEVSAGRALRALHLMGGCRRDQIFVSTKAGYVPNIQVLHDLVADGTISSEDVRGSACMHAALLEASLERSLDALQLQTIDLFYLHNTAESWLKALGNEEYWKRLRLAFEFCEKARKEGKIMAYGMATWGSFRSPPTCTNEHVSLQKVVNLAKEVGGETEHGFRAVQLPINAQMNEVFTEKWQKIDGQEENVTFMEAASKLEIAVFGSAPMKERSLVDDADLVEKLENLPELKEIEGKGAKLVQIARSVPGVVSVLVGQKTPAHVEENIALTRRAPLSEEEFSRVMGALKT